MSETLTQLVVDILAAGFRGATPILFVTLGEIFGERSGIINLGSEGSMLLGALMGFLGAYFSGNIWIGLLCGVMSGALLSLIFGVLSITLEANQLVAGLALTTFSLAFCRFIGDPMVGLTVPSFKPIVTGLSDVPIIGPILFQQDILVYLGLVLAIISWFILFRTHFGISIRSVGENPEAADTVGINVSRVRYACVLIHGMLAGMGGVYLSLAYTPMWVDGMTAGRGFLALLIAVFALWNPLAAIFGAYLFGVIWSVPIRIQGYGVNIPIYLLQMLPYIFSIAGLAVVMKGLRQRVGAPKALGKPYVRGKKE